MKSSLHVERDIKDKTNKIVKCKYLNFGISKLWLMISSICCYLPFCNPKPFLLCNFCFPLVHIFCNFYIVFSELFYIFDGILFDICLCIRKSKNIISLRNLYMMLRNKGNNSLMKELVIIKFFFKTYLIWSWLAFISITWFTIFIRVLRFTYLEFQ